MGGDDRDRRGGGRGARGDRGDYRRRDQGEKEGGAPGEYNPSFRGGFGRSQTTISRWENLLLKHHRTWSWLSSHWRFIKYTVLYYEFIQEA